MIKDRISIHGRLSLSLLPSDVKTATTLSHGVVEQRPGGTHVLAVEAESVVVGRTKRWQRVSGEQRRDTLDPLRAVDGGCWVGSHVPSAVQ